MPLPIDKLVDNRFIPTKYLGGGGMADVYEANDTYTHKRVALKIIKEQFSNSEYELERFKNEARYVSMFSHPHIVKIYNIGTYHNDMFISYELANGMTLKEYLDERGHLKEDECLNIITQVLQASKHIHERGVIHNDFKPDNLVIKHDGNIKLLDFGIATHIDEAPSEKVVASIHYAAPEVLQNKEYSVQSDIYSIGVILFELLTGKTPYMKSDAQEEIRAHLQENTPSISKYIHINNVDEFDYIIGKATNRILSQRYKNDDEMMNDLIKLKKGESLHKRNFFQRIFKK